MLGGKKEQQLGNILKDAKERDADILEVGLVHN